MFLYEYMHMHTKVKLCAMHNMILYFKMLRLKMLVLNVETFKHVAQGINQKVPNIL